MSKKDELRELLKSCRIKHDDNHEQPPVCLKIRNNKGLYSSFGTLGDFSTIIGKAKSRKTYLVSILAASAISNDLGEKKVSGSLPNDKKNVLYFDTEQSDHHVVKLCRRIVVMAGKENSENLFMYALRSLSVKERLELIEFAINIKPNVGLVIIDGVKDLVTSINDEDQSNLVVSKLLKWSKEKHCHIINILHQNKGNEHARGHIGTELVNKSVSVFSVTKCADFPDTSIVKPLECRDREPDPFAFKVDENGMPHFVDDFVDNVKSSKNKTLPDSTLWFLINEAFSNDSEKLGFGYSELVRQLKLANNNHYPENKIGDNRTKELITECKNKGMIVQNGAKKPYIINKNYN